MTSDLDMKTETGDTRVSYAVNSEKATAHRWATFNWFNGCQLSVRVFYENPFGCQLQENSGFISPLFN